MNKYQVFLDWIEKGSKQPWPDEVHDVIRELTEKSDQLENKPLFTENGLAIFKYLRENDTRQKAKDIADGMGISSRTVSGSIRKLVTDGYVTKCGENPIIYELTEQGRNFIFN